LSPRGQDPTEAINAAIAKNVLHEELGYYSDQPCSYNLDQSTRDTLLAHARQDAAHALVINISLLRESAQLKERINRLEFCVVVLMFGMSLLLAEHDSWHYIVNWWTELLGK
jgi:hypothetical protein